VEAAMTQKRGLRFLTLAIVAWTFLLNGCASYRVTRDLKGDGYVVYRPEPYLLVSYSKTGEKEMTTTATVVWLPNYHEGYRVESRSGWFGKADFKFTFVDGWMLTGVEDRGDNSEFAGKLLDVIKSTVPGQAKPGVAVMRAPGLPPVELWRFVFDEQTGEFTGLQQVGSTH
jgi:hypothetical protein